MKLATRLVMTMMALSALVSPSAELEAYGYQPDCGGYAYMDSGYSVTSSPLIPLAVVGVAVIIGVLVYSGGHHHHHHGH